MMTVSVFGGTGFLGQRLVRRLATEGMAVRVVTRDAERARVALHAAGLERMTVFCADVRNQAAVAGALAGAANAWSRGRFRARPSSARASCSGLATRCSAQ